MKQLFNRRKNQGKKANLPKKKTDNAKERPKLVENEEIQAIIEATPAFDAYKVKGRIECTAMHSTVRPANLFYDEIGLDYTKPDEKLFAINTSPDEFTELLSKIVQVEVTAGNRHCEVFRKKEKLKNVFGNKTYRMSKEEILNVLDSQRIHLTKFLTKDFYISFKNAMILDEIVTLPGTNREPMTIKELMESKEHNQCKKFLNEVAKAPEKWGFGEETMKFSLFEQLTLYQVGSMVVKTETYHCFTDMNYLIAEREVGEPDDLFLVNSCGIRSFFRTTSLKGNEDHQVNRMILKEMYKTVLQAIGEGGYYILPALGMGVWRGIPDVYWNAFLNAVVEIEFEIGYIFVSPGHQENSKGERGQEFQSFLDKKLTEFPENANLRLIVNLYEYKTDNVALAKALKKTYPEKRVALQNASDPDVTLGNHVGEYVNNLHHGPTTEENLTAIGTNGICFEKFTKVLEDDSRVLYYG